MSSSLPLGNQNIRQYLHWKKLDENTDNNISLEHNYIDYNQGERAIARQIVSKFSNTTLVPTYELYLDSNENVNVVVKKQILYLDDDHLTKFGTLLAITRLKKFIKRSLQID